MLLEHQIKLKGNSRQTEYNILIRFVSVGTVICMCVQLYNTLVEIGNLFKTLASYDVLSLYSVAVGLRDVSAVRDHIQTYANTKIHAIYSHRHIYRTYYYTTLTT